VTWTTRALSRRALERITARNNNDTVKKKLSVNYRQYGFRSWKKARNGTKKCEGFVVMFARKCGGCGVEDREGLWQGGGEEPLWEKKGREGCRGKDNHVATGKPSKKGEEKGGWSLKRIFGEEKGFHISEGGTWEGKPEGGMAFENDQRGKPSKDRHTGAVTKEWEDNNSIKAPRER